MKGMTGFLVVGMLLCGTSLSAQEAPPLEREEPAPEEEKELTPQETMKLLHEIEDLMDLSEELLYNSSLGKALETSEELKKKIEELLREDREKPPPSSDGGTPQENPGENPQEETLRKVEKLMGKAQEKQGGTIERIRELIRRAKQAQQSMPGPPKHQQQEKKEQQQPRQQNQSNNPATQPYDPNRNELPSRFRSKADQTDSWGHLPPSVREAMLHGRDDIDDYPPEFRERLKEYMEKLADPDNR